LCGIGLLIGNLLAGQIHMQVHGDFTTTFAVGTGLALALLLVFALLFPHQPAAEDERPLAGSHRSI
jgi:predicted MFS family arabinose efflux permease